MEPSGTYAPDLVRAHADTWALSEGPWWDQRRQRLLWVDILGRSLLGGQLLDGALFDVRARAFDHMVSAVSTTLDGTMILAAEDRLLAIRRDGSITEGPSLLQPGAGRRLNDATTDPCGRLLVGSLRMDGPSATECLFQVDTDGSVRTLDDDLTLSNGLAWSSAGDRLFSVDTLRRCVYVRDYDADSGTAGTRRVHLELEHGFPDGIAVDADDHLWVAIWGGGAVHRYDPTGELVQRVRVPAPHTSCVAFAGSDLRTLVITTARAELSDGQLAAWPLSGSILTLRVRTRGLPVWTATATWAT
ncbi:SMP-30/gluconolactonase/LRE family protein [Nocardioides sp. WG-D5]